MSETLKIEAGRYYKTRDGRKAFVMYVASNPFQDEQPHYFGFVDDMSLAWNQKGFCGFDGVTPDKHDLIAPWTEPRKFKLWVYALPGIHHARGFCSKQGSEWDERLIAIVEVTEGDGLKEQP